MKAVIVWFANNAVAANLSMVLILASGLLILPLLEREVAPQIAFDTVEVWVALPGAGPEQVERTISRKIEQSLIGIEGILDVTTQAKNNVSITQIEISNKFSINEVVNKVRTRIDAIRGFPEEASRPIVSDIKIKEPVLFLALSGDSNLYSLNKLAEFLVAEMRALPGVSLVYMIDAPSRELLVEVSENNLQRYQISFAEIAKRIQAAVVDIAGATMQTDEGDVTVVGESIVKTIVDLEDIAIRSTPDGARIVLSDLAAVQDNYKINERYKKFDGKHAVYIMIDRGPDEDILNLAAKVHGFVKKSEQQLPAGVSLTVLTDVSKAVGGRIDLLTNNAAGGFFLVLLVLLLFMNLKLSFWVSLGIPVSFLGAFFILYFWGGTLNMVSLFAFILVLGIVVDDAIIVGESVYTRHEQGMYGVRGSIAGTLDVYRPVIFAILTTIIAFVPMLFMPGEEGRLILVVPVIVISVLIFSLLESLFILPAHLASIKEKKSEILPLINKLQGRFSNSLDRFIQNQYKPFLEKALYWRYAVLVTFLFAFFISIAILGFRWINVSLISHIESDVLIARLGMIEDTSAQETLLALKRLEQAANQIKKEVNDELGFEQIVHVASALDDNVGTNGSVAIYLDTTEDRAIEGVEIENRLLELFGDVPRVRSLSIRTSFVGEGAQIDLELAHNDVEKLEAAAQELKTLLLNYKGVKSAWDNLTQGRREVTFSLKPEAGDMGITNAQVAVQIRQAFYGDSVTIYDEHNNHIPVRIEYPKDQRNSLWFLENLSIKIKDDSSVPLYTVADFQYRDGPAVINLHNGKRTIRIKARLESTVSEGQIMAALRKDFFPQLGVQYPGMTWTLAGGQKRGNEVLSYLALAYPLSLLLMYLLMATLFASYSQPLMIMYAIPYGLVGALLGHLIMGIGFTLWSLMGIIAVSGVVVNDNLVLVDRINRRREEGLPLLDAIREAGVSRFRPIILTSITTFLGLVPLMFEDSIQAQFLIPMAVSLAFGVMFATAISLILVPVLYNILDDLQSLLTKQNLDARFNNYLRKKLNSQD